jgi:hypothetical protein
MNEVTMFLFWLIVSMPAVCGGLTSDGTPTTWGLAHTGEQALRLNGLTPAN